MERVTRIELASPAWKAGALAIVLHPHLRRIPQWAAALMDRLLTRRLLQIISLKRIPYSAAFVNILRKIFFDILLLWDAGGYEPLDFLVRQDAPGIIRSRALSLIIALASARNAETRLVQRV